jgi:hypothetical protein
LWYACVLAGLVGVGPVGLDAVSMYWGKDSGTRDEMERSG